MVAVYSHIATPRLQYLLRFLSDYYAVAFTLFTEEEIFLAQPAVQLNYSDKKLGESFQIKPSKLLFESNVHPIPISCFQHQNGYPAFFSSADELGFDLFAAVFFLLSRYEEYLPHYKDSYGRYAHENSVAFQNGFLHLPLIDRWLEDFRYQLNKFGAAPVRKFSFLPTYDIDMAWSYRYKGFLRNGGGLLRSALQGNWAMIKRRINVLAGRASDPYDCFDWLKKIHRFYDLVPAFFFHVGKERTTYDKSIPVSNAAFWALLKETAALYTIGLHPSWQSGDMPSLIGQEKRTLEAVAGTPVSASRQHYIRFTLPQTFQQLVVAGITDDYSMGYGSINGFRASTASSFYWYDLEREVETKLCLHPFCFMDANAYYEQKLSAAEAYKELLHYYHEVKKVNGRLITIWHNNILGSDVEFEGWKDVYQQFLEYIATDS